MELSNRLKAIVNEVHYPIAADIGTDHAYVLIELLLKNKIQKGIACDIKKGPLEKAKENIISFGLSNKIQIKMGNGLSVLNSNEVDTAIIAGMGGMLMIDILKQSFEVVKNLKELILQPQLDIDSVRKYLHTINFQIANETMVLEDGKFYTVIRAVQGKEVYKKEEEYIFGKILLDRKDKILKNYLFVLLEKQEKIIGKLNLSSTQSAKHKLEKLKQEKSRLEGIYQCL